jgi:hypothetical protein
MVFLASGEIVIVFVSSATSLYVENEEPPAA